MNWITIGAAASMGLLGGTHCIAMCGASAACTLGRQAGGRELLAFHGGRAAGYATAGALLATLTASLEWMSQLAGIVRPMWIALNVAVLILGGMLLVRARQPALLEQLALDAGRTWRGFWQGQARYSPVQPVVLHRATHVPPEPPPVRPVQAACTGFAWTLVPCGMLYSALMLAAFSGGGVNGAFTMAAFAIGSGLQLAAAQFWMTRWRTRNPRRERVALRVAGAALCATAGYALAVQMLGHDALGALCLVGA